MDNRDDIPFPLFPASRNNPRKHDWMFWLTRSVICLYVACVAVNLSLLFHLWAP